MYQLMRPNPVVTIGTGGDFHPDAEAVESLTSRLQQTDGRTRVKVMPADSVELSDISDTTVFFGWPSESMLEAMPGLRWVHLPSAGANAFVGNPRIKSGILLTTSSGVFGVAGAEHALSLLFALARDLRFHVEATVDRTWGKHSRSFEVFESTIGVFGLGNIGSEIARRLHCLGAEVIGVRRRASEPKPDYLRELAPFEAADDVLPRCDAVVLALPETPLTRGFLNEARIARMKQDALLVNVGRGTSVDQAALSAALKDGTIRGAGLDVTDPEPLPREDPLWQAPNVIITSHSMNVFDRKDERRFDVFARNFSRFVAGQPLENLVDHERGY